MTTNIYNQANNTQEENNSDSKSCISKEIRGSPFFRLIYEILDCLPNSYIFILIHTDRIRLWSFQNLILYNIS